jgi:hypothetical protein
MMIMVQNNIGDAQSTAVDQKASLQTAARYQKTEESRD